MADAVNPTIPPSGHIGCCDDSLTRHASEHWRAEGHPIIRSFEPGEDWFWNYDSDEYYDGPELAPPQCHPLDQTAPGPSDRVPKDWMTQLQRRGD